MSDLVTVSAEIAPYLTLAANSLGTAVIATAQQRIADRTVTAGEGFFRRLLHGRGRLGGGNGEPVLDTRRADALDQLLAGLDDEQWRRLFGAVATWLDDSDGPRDAERLLAHISRQAPATVTKNNTVTVHGHHIVAANEIHGAVTLNDGSAPQDGS